VQRHATDIILLHSDMFRKIVPDGKNFLLKAEIRVFIGEVSMFSG